jgi:hypothetical protein
MEQSEKRERSKGIKGRGAEGRKGREWVGGGGWVV